VNTAELLWSSVDAAGSAVAEAAHLGTRFERDPIDLAYPHLGASLRSIGPAVLTGPGGQLAVVRTARRTMVVVTPDGGRHRVRTTEVRDWTVADIEVAVEPEVRALPVAARPAVLAARLAGTRVAAGWRVRPSADAPLRLLARQAHLGRRLALVVVSQAAVYTVFLAVWAVVAGAAARGDLTGGAVAAGTILLLALAPLRALATWSAGTTTVEAGAILKRRLLGGIVAVEPDSMRHRGAGQLLGLTLEAEALETLALTGGYAALLGTAEVAAAGVAILAGVRATLLLSLLAAWVAAGALVARAYLRRRQAWSRSRLRLTHRLVEQMVGHRTRLAQEGTARHDPCADRQTLTDYAREATIMDRAAVVLGAIVPRGWMVTGFVALLVPFPAGANPVRVAASVGGVLLAFHALEKLAYGTAQLADAMAASRELGPLLRPSSSPATPLQAAPATVELNDVSFAYDGRTVLRDVSLRIRPGDRVLLQGPSGAGKSTLAALLSGTRPPSSGTVTGSSAVTTAPQYHENHVFGASFAFNLLLGRRWPATNSDLQEAWTICDELGLGPLLTTMPAGLAQPIGEVGWQLSHGERSRLYVARALLTDASVVVLDEAFATLDPEALRRTLTCVLNRAQALVVIAHQ
jgi:ATP-binding cassette subfamily B protein